MNLFVRLLPCKVANCKVKENVETILTEDELRLLLRLFLPPSSFSNCKNTMDLMMQWMFKVIILYLINVMYCITVRR